MFSSGGAGQTPGSVILLGFALGALFGLIGWVCGVVRARRQRR